MKLKWTSYPYIVWMAIFIIVPLLLILFFSVTSEDVFRLGEFQFTLDNFKRFMSPIYLKVLGRSITLALQSTAICFLLGYPMAMIISKAEVKKRNAMILLFVVPMWMNFLLRTYAWLTLLGKNGLINYIIKSLGFEPLNLIYNNKAILLGMVYNFLPFMVLPIYSVLIKIDNSLIEAAEDLGASKLEVFTRIILPLSIPGVVSGFTMVFMPAVSTFVISSLLGGGKYMLIGNLVEQQFLWSEIGILVLLFL